jgi:hypothetical protein
VPVGRRPSGRPIQQLHGGYLAAHEADVEGLAQQRVLLEPARIASVKPMPAQGNHRWPHLSAIATVRELIGTEVTR